jgi:hypothetical protein
MQRRGVPSGGTITTTIIRHIDFQTCLGAQQSLLRSFFVTTNLLPFSHDTPALAQHLRSGGVS